MLIAVYVVAMFKNVEIDEDDDFIDIEPTFDNSNEKLKVNFSSDLFSVTFYIHFKTNFYSLDSFFSVNASFVSSKSLCKFVCSSNYERF